VVAEAVPSTEELIGGAPEAAKPPPAKAPKETSTPQKTAQVSAPAPIPESVPTTEEVAASKNQKAGPDTSGGDAWMPKEVPKPVKAPPVPAKEPMKVAMIPKAAPVDNSIENILNIAKEGKPVTPHEGDSWTPQKTKTPKPEVDIDREVARIRAQENKQAVQHRVEKIKKDINNPEEGVLPVSTFEKFMGPMYGRHREYERRFVPGKNRRAKVPDHDFFVDEVDRKKEIHNIYYYVHQKGVAPKLVAVERHDKVTFLGNYDIEKENKGKISTY
jgi:hypothetical protein